MEPTPSSSPQIPPSEANPPLAENPTPAPSPSKSPISLNPILTLITITSILLTSFFIYQNWLTNQKLQQLIESQTITSTPSEANPSEALAKEDTASWKTYTNTKYGYTLKYPQTWIAKDTATGAGNETPPSDAEGVTLYDPITIGQDYPKGALTIQVFDLAPTYPNEFKVEETFFDGVRATAYSGKIQELMSVSYVIKLPNDSGYLEIGFLYGPDEGDQALPPILSTFQFTN